MEFIDHGHRVLGANGGRHLAVIGMQGGVQALQQVLEIEDRQLQLGLLVLLAHLDGGVVEQTVFGSRFGFLEINKRFDVRKDSVICSFGPTLFLQAALGEAEHVFALRRRIVLTPGLQFIHPIGNIV